MNILQARCRSNCAFHKFIIKPKDDISSQSTISVNYCPIFNQLNNSVNDIYPKLNADGKKYFPLFALDIERDGYKMQEEKYIEEHEKKVRDYVQKKTILYEPKPGRKTKYCAVCRSNYEDYLEHANSKFHTLNCKNNQYFTKIDILSQNFQKQKSFQILNYICNESLTTIKENTRQNIENEEANEFIANETLNIEEESNKNLANQQNNVELKIMKQENNFKKFIGTNRISGAENQLQNFYSQENGNHLKRKSKTKLSFQCRKMFQTMDPHIIVCSQEQSIFKCQSFHNQVEKEKIQEQLIKQIPKYIPQIFKKINKYNLLKR